MNSEAHAQGRSPERGKRAYQYFYPALPLVFVEILPCDPCELRRVIYACQVYAFGIDLLDVPPSLEQVLKFIVKSKLN